MKVKEWCRVASQEEIAAVIYSMWLETPSIDVYKRQDLSMVKMRRDEPVVSVRDSP